MSGFQARLYIHYLTLPDVMASSHTNINIWMLYSSGASESPIKPDAQELDCVYAPGVVWSIRCYRLLSMKLDTYR